MLVYAPGVGDGNRAEQHVPLAPDASTSEYAWSLAKGWSTTAVAIKRTLTRARAATLVLLVAGATAGAIGATANTDDATRGWAVAAALALASAGILETFVVTPARTRDWASARNASERLTAEVWLHITGVAPYDGDDDERERILRQAIDAIEAQASLDDVRTIDLHRRALPDPGEQGAAALYVRDRADDQLRWHRENAAVESRKGTRLRIAVLVLSAGGAVLVSLSSIPSVFDGTPLAAWVATLSAATGAVTTHARASRHDDIAHGYDRTTRRLRVATNRFNQEGDKAAALPAFVHEVERILAAQNENWTDTIER